MARLRSGRAAVWMIVLMMAGAGSARAENGDDPGRADAVSPPFDAVWVHQGYTSAVVYWHVADISREASDSRVEYGPTTEYGSQTQMITPQTTTKIRKANTRWGHIHWIKGLSPDTTYHYRLVMTYDGKEVQSQDMTLKTKPYADAIKFTGKSGGKGAWLSKANATYVLTEDINASGKAAIVLRGDNVTLDMDGHTVTFTGHGLKIFNYSTTKMKILNGFIRQSGGSGKAVESHFATNNLEIAGVFIEVNRPFSTPINLQGRNKNGNINIHHNHIYSGVSEMEFNNRARPGNNFFVITSAPDFEVNLHHNVLTEGCHRGIKLGKEIAKIEIYENDIRLHQQYVDGYTISAIGKAKVHHNHVTSSGLGMQIGSNVEIAHNWFDIQGHAQKNDMPGEGPPPWRKLRTELSAFKFSQGCTNVKLHHNYVRVTQHQPKDKWDYVPAAPLILTGIGSENAKNEVWENTIVAITTYKKTRHGDYGDAGQWASAIFFKVGKGKRGPGKHSIYVHDNKFISNDLFMSGKIASSAVRIEKNTFKLAENPTEGHSVFRDIPDDVRARIIDGGNTFVGMEP